MGIIFMRCFFPAGHHTDKWQHQAMYVGLHFPSSRHGKKHRHKRRQKSRKHDKEHDTEPAKPRKYL